MAAPYSIDLRERVVAARQSGLSRLETAQLYEVSESSVQRWCRLDRQTGSAAAKPMGGKKPFVLAAQRDWIVARIAKQPDLPLRALLAELRGRGVKVGYFAVWNIVKRAGLSFKKKPARQRAGQARRRSPPAAMARSAGQG
jgi:transposase